MECVWMVPGNGVPTVRHATEEAARQEAARLARRHAGQEFVVLKSVATVVRSDLSWTKHEEYIVSKLPF